MLHDGGRAVPPGHGDLRDLICAWILSGAAVVDGELDLAEIAMRSAAPNDELRLALEQLAGEGVIELTEDWRAVVRVPTAGTLADVDAVRSDLEALAARRFIDNASDRQRGALREAAAEFRRLAELRMGPGELMRARDRFYQVLLRGAGGMNTIALLADLRVTIALVFRAGLVDPERAIAIAGELETIADALAAGELDRAVHAIEEHVALSSQAAARMIGLVG